VTMGLVAGRRSALLAALVAVVAAWLTGCASGEEAPSAAERRSARQAWSQPALEDPERLVVTSDDAHLRLQDGRDYLIEFGEPVSRIGGVVLDGGRNVVLRDGHITIPPAGPDPSIQDRRGLFIQEQTGTVHVERLVIDNSGGDLSEGIQIAAPDAVVQLIDVRVDGVHARDQVEFTDNHPDVVQPWGGVRELRVERLTGVTAYQGIFLKADRAPIGRVILRDVNLRGVEGARYLLWAAPEVEVEVDNVWIEPAPRRSHRLSVRPEPPDRTWAGVRIGVPPDGDFVPAPAALIGGRS
jgi:hypothetical protein